MSWIAIGVAFFFTCWHSHRSRLLLHRLAGGLSCRQLPLVTSDCHRTAAPSLDGNDHLRQPTDLLPLSRRSIALFCARDPQVINETRIAQNLSDFWLTNYQIGPHPPPECLQKKAGEGKLPSWVDLGNRLRWVLVAKCAPRVALE